MAAFTPGFFVPPPPKSRQEYEHRWAGLRAHNRWLVDFCDGLPGRRAGIAQIMLDDIDDAIAEINWVADVGLKGGVLLPGIPPGSEKTPLYSELYGPIWRACEERGVVDHKGTARLGGAVACQNGDRVTVRETGEAARAPGSPLRAAPATSRIARRPRGPAPPPREGAARPRCPPSWHGPRSR